MNNQLYCRAASIEFYENRYRNGYMDDWDVEVKKRSFGVIRNLDLPEIGAALDYGCGNGVLTQLLSVALPKWKIYGTDISSQAIANAEMRYPQFHFFVDEAQMQKFDLVFTHHVLEHVYDIDRTINHVQSFLKPNGHVLHVMPCGNEGSFEHCICSIRKDGIDGKLENRFFFEDEGHVRRMTTQRLSQLMSNYHFNLTKAFYRNQFWGGWKWITQGSSKEFIKKFADPTMARDKAAKRLLSRTRFKLLLSYYFQKPVLVFNRYRRIKRNLKQQIIFIPLCFLSAIVSPYYFILNSLANKEWLESREKTNGSEMFLFYKRESFNT
jgi:SAM-dependent methyltransferase